MGVMGNRRGRKSKLLFTETHCWGLSDPGQVGRGILKFVYFQHFFFRNSAVDIVGIATDYGLNHRGVGVRGPVGSRIFSASSRPALGSIEPPIQWVPRVLSRGVKQPGREADHSPPTSAEVKKMWIYTSTPLYVFMA
jgi:hypothetical protein